jgi:acyl-CoA thioesterase-1
MATQLPGNGQRSRIVALGDSLTSGHGIGHALAFPAVLQQRLDRAGYHYQVVNAGVSGDTSNGAVERLPWLLDSDVAILIVALGVNDGLRGVPVRQIEANLARIIEQAQRRGIAVLLCAMEALPLYGWSYTVAFHRLFGDLAATYAVPVVPFMLANIIGRAEMLQADRLHPNAAGARVMADHIWPHLQRLLNAARPMEPFPTPSSPS